MKPEEAIQNLEYAVKAYHESGDSWNESDDEMDEALKIAIQAIEKQIPKKPITDDNRILCPECNLLIAYNKSIEQHCWTCGQNLEGCVIK